ncbi:NAD(P)-dependent oxidoreductase [soil metagenome]
MQDLAIVTGVPGWLGSNLVETLLKSGPRQVRAFCLKDSDTGELAKLGEHLKFVQGDLATGEGLDTLTAGAKGATVFHIAGVIHPSQGRKQFYDINLEGTRQMLAAAVNAGAKRFIYVSSNSPIGCNKSTSEADRFDEKSQYNPYMHYGLSKKMAEDLVNQANNEGKIETVIIRPPWFYGPHQPLRQTLFFTMIKDGKMPIVGSGENLRSMAYVDNICQGLTLCEQIDRAKGKTYWIADQRPYTMNEIVNTVEKVLENDFQIKCSHKRMYLPNLASDVAYIVDGTLQGLGLYHQKFHVLSEMNKNIACKIDLAQAELGYNPQIALEEGMRRSIKWILDRGQKI